MFYLLYLCLFTYSGVQQILCCVLFSSCIPSVASFSRLSILVAPSVFSNVYSLERLNILAVLSWTKKISFHIRTHVFLILNWLLVITDDLPDIPPYVPLFSLFSYKMTGSTLNQTKSYHLVTQKRSLLNKIKKIVHFSYEQA